MMKLKKKNNLKRIINNNYDQLKVKLEQPQNGLLTILDHITNELEIISNKTQTPVNRNNLNKLQDILNELVNLKNENKDFLKIFDNLTNDLESNSNKTSQILNKTNQVSNEIKEISNETNSTFQAAALQVNDVSNEIKEISNETSQILNKTTQVSNEINQVSNETTQLSNTIENAQRAFNLQLETTFNEIKNRLESALQTVNLRLNKLEEKSKGLQYISNILILEESNRDISSAHIDCDFGDFVRCEIALVEFRTTGNVGRGTIHVSIRSLRDGYYRNKLKKSIYSFQHNGGRIRQKPPALIYYSIIKVIPRTSSLHVSFTYEDGNSVNLRNCYLKFHVRKYMRINDENVYYEEGINQFGKDLS